MSESELLDLIEKNQWAISPQCNGGWVIQDSDGEQERDIAVTRGTLREALLMAAQSSADL